MTQAANLAALGTNATSTGGLTGANLGTPSALVLTNATGLGRAAMPAGSVIQTINVVTGTEQYTTSYSPVATSIAASITPYYSTSKILVIASMSYYIDGNNATSGGWNVTRNGSTQVASFNDACQINLGATVTRFAMPNACLTFFDSPATTSSTTYTIYMFRRTGTGQIGVNGYGSPPAPSSGITLMEIAQ